MNERLSTAARQFYTERDKRSLEFTDGAPITGERVTVAAGEDVCRSMAGQLLLSTIGNLLSRVHRSIVIELGDPDALLKVRTLTGATTVGEELRRVMQRADPYGQFAVDHHSGYGEALSFRTGMQSQHWYLGVDRACATLSYEPQVVGSEQPADRRGAILAAILGSATAFKEMLGMQSLPYSVSAWNLQSDALADPGPAEFEEIAVGRVLVAGAGAVASGLAYCLWHWGATGTWVVIDGDVVKLHNTNRSLLFFPDEADWNGRPGRLKAEILAPYFPNAVIDPCWYDESAYASEPFDTVLVLANERDVRTRIARRNDPIQLHATTGRSWLSQLHRHIPGLDDCIRCRMDDVRAPRFNCSDGATETEDAPKRPDAALPFLSVAGGLMLAVALQRLNEATFWSGRHNTWRWDFRAADQMHSAGRHRCRVGCDVLLPAAARASVAANTIWRDQVEGGTQR